VNQAEKNAAKGARQHTIYKNANSIRVPGVTTVTGVMDKPALVPWANNLGLQGIKVREYVDALAKIGTLAHYMIECYLKKIEANLDQYSKNDIDAAENCVIKFYEWEKRNDFQVIESEMKMVSERLQVGGTCDCYAMLNGKKTLVDFKTCKAVYDDHFTQVAAYGMLLKDNGYEVDDIRILRIGRDESEGFDDVAIKCRALHERRFAVCRELYTVNSLIRKGGR